jgi:hypothetical protein
MHDRPVCFDLLSGSIKPAGGDLRVTVGRLAGVVSQRHWQDWSLEIEAPEGGLIEADMGQEGVTFPKTLSRSLGRE